MDTTSFSMKLLLDVYSKGGFRTQKEAADVSASLRCSNLKETHVIPELGKAFVFQDRHAACLDLAHAVQAVYRRYQTCLMSKTTITQPEDIAVAGDAGSLHACVMC